MITLAPQRALFSSLQYPPRSSIPSFFSAHTQAQGPTGRAAQHAGHALSYLIFSFGKDRRRPHSTHAYIPRQQCTASAWPHGHKNLGNVSHGCMLKRPGMGAKRLDLALWMVVSRSRPYVLGDDSRRANMGSATYLKTSQGTSSPPRRI